jgi:glutamyl-tRNA reductase
MTHDHALRCVEEELDKATDTWPNMASAHEGYAIIKEELDELWEEIKLNPSKRNVDRLRSEATQVAAMAIRFLKDLC